jgi:3-oxoacyl-[acyl-carrier protein] reductase
MAQERTLAGRVAVVTGVSRKAGIGYAIAQRLAERGAHLFLHGLASYDAMQPYGADPGGMAEIVTDLRAFGGKVAYVSADFADPDAPERVLGTAQVEYGRVDILVANHAYSRNDGLGSLMADEIDNHLLVNVRGTMLLIQAFTKQYDTLGGGRVILMLSGPHQGPMSYAASKGALAALVPSLARAVAHKKITVNGVNPGPTDTGWADRQTKDAVIAAHPQRRWSQPDDAARLVAWLASDDAEWITGQVIDSTGGL